MWEEEKVYTKYCELSCALENYLIFKDLTKKVIVTIY